MTMRTSLLDMGEVKILCGGLIFGVKTRKAPKTLVVWLVAVGLEREVQ
jgi:hypothetical protein